MTNSETKDGNGAFSTTLDGSVRVVLAGLLVCLFAMGAGAATADRADSGSLSGEVIQRLIDEGSYPQAEAAAREFLDSTESAHGVDSVAAADARDLLVAALIANSRATEQETLELAQRAVELRLKTGEDDSLPTTDGLLNLGSVLKENKRLDEAEAILQRGFEIRERELGRDHLDVVRVINELGSVAYRGRGPDLAESRYGRALAVLEATVGASHPECAKSLTGLFAVSMHRRQFEDAERFQLRALEIRQRSLGPEHPLTAETMRALAVLWHRMGNDRQAEALLRQAVDGLEQALGPEHPQTGAALNSLAICVRDRGRYAEARGFFERALKTFETSLDPLDPRIAGVLNNLAAVHRELGDFTEAEEFLRRSLAIREARYGSDHPAVAQSLGNLANVLVEAERPAEAVPLLERALAIKEGAYGRSSVEYAVSLASLGRACNATGDLDCAERSIEEAVAIFEAHLGPDNTMVADQLNNLALVNHERGDLDAAREGLLRAIEIRRFAEGEDHPLVGRYQYNLARVEADDGRFDRAVDFALQAEASSRIHLQLTARGLAEDEAIGFDQYTRNRLDLLLAFSLRWPQHTARVWDALIRSRGLVLNELVARRRAAATDDPEVAALHDELTTTAEGLAKLSIRGAGKASPDEYREELASARNEVERFERALGEASAAFRDDRRRSRIGYDEVAHALPPGTALIGFTRRSIFWDPVGTGTPDTFDYMAMVLAPGASAPKPIILGPAPEIDALVLAWRRAAVRPGVKKAKHSEDEETYRRSGETLRRRVWDPLVPLFDGAKTVFVVPDGELGLVNLAALPVGADRYLVEGGVLIHMLDEERDLVDFGAAGPRDSAVLLALGDPDFNWMAGQGESATQDEFAAETRGFAGGCSSLEKVVFSRLPATAKETETVATLWRNCGAGKEPAQRASSCGRTVLRLTGNEATEAEFKRLAPGKTVLHLATHGFVLGDKCEPGSAAGRGIGGLTPGRTKQQSDENLLIGLFGIAGLALAGANHRAQVGPDREDGILTAVEISTMDLDGVEWAVLSACDSGVGESVSGEGVFGFRRAFRIAGAGTVIMSLWPVEDAATQAWMEALYRARLELGSTTAESVRYAGLELLRQRRKQGLSTHPFYWGAFVAAGDWR